MTGRGVDEQTLMTGLARALRTELIAVGASQGTIVVACIGTDRSTGDALGPLVGESLLRLGASPDMVLGNLREPVHALNLDRVARRISNVDRPTVIAVDAALGPADEIGSIRVRRGGLRPGAGVGKQLPTVGDISVTAIVNVSGEGSDAQVLQSTRLYVVQELAGLIAAALWWAITETRVAPTSPVPRRSRFVRRSAEAPAAPVLTR